jgi:hypothetical protein
MSASNGNWAHGPFCEKKQEWGDPDGGRDWLDIVGDISDPVVMVPWLLFAVLGETTSCGRNKDASSWLTRVIKHEVMRGVETKRYRQQCLDNRVTATSAPFILD